MPENRVLKFNEANVQKQKEVCKLHQSVAKNKKGILKQILVIHLVYMYPNCQLQMATMNACEFGWCCCEAMALSSRVHVITVDV